MAKEIQPRLVYQRLLRAADRNTASAASDRRLLDLVREDAQRLQRQLGSADQQRLHEYLESVHSVEQRLDSLPILLAGQGGGRIRTGQHLEYAPDTPLCNLYLSMLQAMGVETKQFSDSTGALSEVLV